MVIASQLLRKRKQSKADIGSLEGLQAFARKAGFEKEAEASGKPDLSVLQRLGRGLTAFETGNSFYHERYSNASFLKTFAGDIATGLSEAFTGREQRKEPKKTFKDIMVKEGIKDRPGKIDPVDVFGLIGDILFDPTTWLGGFVGKQAIKAGKFAGKVAKKAPVIGKPLAAIEEGAKTLFKPFHHVEALGKFRPKTTETFEEFFKKNQNDIRGGFAITEIKAVARGSKPAHYKAIKDKPAIAFAKKQKDLKVIEDVTSAGDYLVVKNTKEGKAVGDKLLQLSKQREKTFATKDLEVINKWNDAFSKLLGFDDELIRTISGTGGFGDNILEARRIFKYIQEEDVIRTGEEYRDAYFKYARGMRHDMDELLGNVSTSAKGLKKEIGKKEFKKVSAGGGITEAIETGIKTGNKFVDEAMHGIIESQKSMAKQEATRGILKNQLEDYVHHMLTPEASHFLAEGGDLATIFKPIRVRLGAAKQRKITGIIKDINENYRKKLGFNLFEEDAFKAFGKRGVDNIKAVRTYDFLERVGHQFGKSAKKGQDKLIDEFGVKWIKTGASGAKLSPKSLKNTLFPEPIAKHIDEINKMFSNDEATNVLLRYYDKALAIFKGSVTGYFPAFHTRNAMGGMFNNFIAGLKDPTIYKKANDILNKKAGFIKKADGGQISYDTIRQLVKEYGVTGQTGYLDVAQFLQKEVNPTIKSRILREPQRVMGFVEDHLRVPLFIDGLAKGMKPADAGRRVIQFHFDYMPEGFTAFEKNIMKRIIPFYTWTRHNIPLQIEQVIKQPGKYAGVFKVQNSWGATPSSEEEGVLPIWLRERFTIKDEGGYWSGIGIPLEEATEKLSQPLRGFGISLSPFIRIPIEQLTGFNIFKDMKIDEDRFGKYYKNMPKPIKNWLQLKVHTTKKGKKHYTVNPRRKYWIETIGMRGWNTALRLSNHVDDKKNLLSLITTIKKYNYTLEDMKRWSDFDKRKELEQALIRAGKLAEFRRTYIPKNN